MNPEARLESLHAAYQRLSGRPVPWTRANMHRWAHLVHELAVTAVTIEEALPMVIERIKRLSRGCSGFEHHLNFSKITDPGVFQDHWSAAIAEARKPAPSATVKAMGQLTGKKYEAPGNEARKAEEVINSDGFKKLMKFRDNL